MKKKGECESDPTKTPEFDKLKQNTQNGIVDKQDISNIMSYLSDNRAPIDAQKYEMRYFASMFFGKCLKCCSRNKKKTPF